MMPRSPGLFHCFFTAFSSVFFATGLTGSPILAVGVNFQTAIMSVLFGHGWLKIINQVYEDKN